MKSVTQSHTPVFNFSRIALVAVATFLMGAQGFGAYPSEEETPAQRTEDYNSAVALMQDLAAKNPTVAQTFQLGVNNGGQAIMGLKVGTGAIHNLLVATHHGNEYGSTEIAKAFAKDLVLKPIQGQTIYIIPVLNIPGYNMRARRETVNSRSYDPNRDYPGPCGSEGPFHLNSTKALADFVEREGIVASSTIHTFSPAVLYPWGVSTHDLSTPYDAIFIELANLATQESHYTVGNSTEVLYAADGTFEDYAFWKHGIWSLLFEAGYSHSPNATAVAELIRVNVPGLRRMYEHAPSARADDHAFHGKCDTRMRSMDRHDE